MINKIFRSYVELPRNIILLFGVELCLSLVHVAFILILNIYLRKVGYSDPDIAAFNSLRFIGALAFSLPLGIYIRGKKLKRFFIFSSFLVPIISIVLIESISSKISPLIQTADSKFIDTTKISESEVLAKAINHIKKTDII